jgi:hypothetical protein
VMVTGSVIVMEIMMEKEMEISLHWDLMMD